MRPNFYIRLHYDVLSPSCISDPPECLLALAREHGVTIRHFTRAEVPERFLLPKLAQESEPSVPLPGNPVARDLSTHILEQSLAQASQLCEITVDADAHDLAPLRIAMSVAGACVTQSGGCVIDRSNSIHGAVVVETNADDELRLFGQGMVKHGLREFLVEALPAAKQSEAIDFLCNHLCRYAGVRCPSSPEKPHRFAAKADHRPRVRTFRATEAPVCGGVETLLSILFAA